jgi:hypothetical protein
MKSTNILLLLLFLQEIVFSAHIFCYMSQRALIERNYDLSLDQFRVRNMPGNPFFLDAWQRARTPKNRLLLLEYTLETIYSAIAQGARPRQIYVLTDQLRNFVTDQQFKLEQTDRILFEVQLEQLYAMKWDTV